MHQQSIHRRSAGLFAGVCTGLSEALKLNPWFTRLVFVGLTLANGVGLGLYFLLALLIPKYPLEEHADTTTVCRSRSILGAIRQPAKRSIIGYLTGLVVLIASLLAFAGNVTTLSDVGTIYWYLDGLLLK